MKNRIRFLEKDRYEYKDLKSENRAQNVFCLALILVCFQTE